jgi:tRNA/tmRNA/rRNA uracil-C5-methylase (TrmA/RlmC/RlmD family)
MERKCNDAMRAFVLACLVLWRHVDGFMASAPHRPSPPLPRLFASTRSNAGGNKRSRKNIKKKTNQRYRKEPELRPVLTDYSENRNDFVNDERLQAAINCEHFDSCPGCIVNNHVGQVEIIKSAKQFFSSTAVRKRRLDVIADIVVEDSDDGFYQVVVPSSVTGWRTQAKLAVAPKSSSWAKDGCAFGLFRRGTHSVLSIPNCKVHHPAINRAVEALVAATEKVGTASFEPDSAQGGLRYVQFQVERTTGRICLTLVWFAQQLKETQPALSRLQKELQRLEPDLWHSMWVHCNDGAGNNIFSRNSNRWHRLIGPEFLREPLPVSNMGWLYFNPLAFRQGNMSGFDVLAGDVARNIPGGSRVCELYAGIGVLGLTALAYHHEKGKPLIWVRCSDSNPANPRCFRRSVDSL